MVQNRKEIAGKITSTLNIEEIRYLKPLSNNNTLSKERRAQ
jgi:hypothetical protein